MADGCGWIPQLCQRVGASLGKAVHLNSDIRGIRRNNDGVYLTLAGQGEIRFDKAILAAHADQSLALINDPSVAECEILGAFSFQDNHAVLHSDQALMPRRQQHGRHGITYPALNKPPAPLIGGAE